MKEPYRVGAANHPDPESCVVSRKVGHEALTGAQRGKPQTRKIKKSILQHWRRCGLR